MSERVKETDRVIQMPPGVEREQEARGLCRTHLPACIWHLLPAIDGYVDWPDAVNWSCNARAQVRM